MTWTLIVLIAGLWALQMLLTWWQSRAFLRELRRLRTRGTVAVGASSTSRMRRRTYVAVAADSGGRVVEAVELSGLTVAARPRRLHGYDGEQISVLAADQRDDRRSRALQQAARTLRDAQGSKKTGAAEQSAPSHRIA